MPQAIAATVAAVKAAAAYIATAATAVSAGTATFAQIAVTVAVNVAAATASSLLFRPNVPTPEFARQAKRQPIPDRVSGYGRVRLGGAYMLYEAVDTRALNVFAMHDGLIAGWVAYYLNDDLVTIDGAGLVQSGPDLRYGKNSDLVTIKTRLGLPTETNYSEVTAIAPSLWPSNARGDGIASLAMIAKSSSKEQFLRDYPNGLPVPSAVADLQYCWDPRLGARGTITTDSDKAASATWVGGSQNPILQLLDYMTNPETGMGLPLSRFLPVIETWEIAADVCEEPVPLEEGGTVERYLSGGSYLHSTAPADVMATILATCDGWLSQDANGRFVVQAGKYYEPTVTITEEHIVGLQRQFWIEDEKATNEMVVSFTDPAFDYTEVEADPWQNTADIEARNGEVRSQRLSLPWVQNNSQARRLAKIATTKASAPIRGTLTTTLDGLRAWSERRIRIQAPSDGDTMADIVVDILPLTLNPDMTVSIPFLSCDPTAYDWDTEEQGMGPGGDTRPPPTAIETPVIDDVEAFQTSDGSTRLRVFVDTTVIGSTYILRTRVTGETVWNEQAEQNTIEGFGFPYFESGLVVPAELELQIAEVTAGGRRSDWSTTFTIDASIVTPLGQPTNFSAYPTGTGVDGVVEMTAQAPTSALFSYMSFYAGATADFGLAGAVFTTSGADPGDFASYSYLSGSGSHYIWVQAFDADDSGSGQLGPIMVTIPD